MRKIAKILLVGACVAWSSVASADYMRSFFANGVTGTGIGQQGSAFFDISNDGSTMSITLNNLLDPNRFAESLLDGIDFTLSQMPTSATLLSVTPTSVINCAGQPVGTTSCPAGSGSSPYGWGSSLGSSFTMGAGYAGGS